MNTQLLNILNEVIAEGKKRNFQQSIDVCIKLGINPRVP